MTAVRLFFAVLLLAVIAGAAFAVGAVRGIIDDAPDIDSINITPVGFATFIYDAEGRELQKLTSSNSNRTAVSIENVPVDLQHAVVAIEDERFYTHSGIDPKGIIRAIVMGIKSRFRYTEGASTITQQLLKNNVFTTWTKERTLIDRIRRKFQEQYLAVKLEQRLNNKQLILENYLNTINLGAGTYGVEAASKKYFGKDVWELNLSECAVIAGITQNPSRYNPIRYPEQNAARRKRILDKMTEQGYITAAQRDEALADDVYARIAAAQEAASASATVYSYFVDELTAQVVSDLVAQKGYTERQAWQMLYSGGLRIYTTQDPAVQAVCDEEYTNPANFPADTVYFLEWALSVKKTDGSTVNYSREMLRDYIRQTEPDFDLTFLTEEQGQTAIESYKQSILAEGDEIIAERSAFLPQPQSSLVVMDPATGCVKAIVGGRGEKTASLTLNRASGSFRQPGSTFKILAAYAPAIDGGVKTIGSYVEDTEFHYATGEEVRNSDGDHRGWITLRTAIAQSVNVAAVKTLPEISPAAGYEQLQRFGITSLDPNRDVVQPLALGGISKGVSNLELTAAYAALANGGVYTRPVFYTRITDQFGNVVLDNTAETWRAVGEDTAYILTDAMRGVVTEGTAQAVQLDSGMPVAGKTGTTNDYRNVWFVGYTPYYAMGIWAGYDNNRTLPEEGTYRDFHKALWKKIMDRLSEGQEVRDFTRPAGVSEAETCGISNMSPSSTCPHVSYDLVSSRYMPVRRCTLCVGGYEGFDYGEYQETAPETTAQQTDDGSAGGENAGGENTGGENTGGAYTEPGTDDVWTEEWTDNWDDGWNDEWDDGGEWNEEWDEEWNEAWEDGAGALTEENQEGAGVDEQVYG